MKIFRNLSLGIFNLWDKIFPSEPLETVSLRIDLPLGSYFTQRDSSSTRASTLFKIFGKYSLFAIPIWCHLTLRGFFHQDFYCRVTFANFEAKPRVLSIIPEMFLKCCTQKKLSKFITSQSFSVYKIMLVPGACSNKRKSSQQQSEHKEYLNPRSHLDLNLSLSFTFHKVSQVLLNFLRVS